MPVCNGCKQDLPTKAFAADKHRATGLRYKCRACSSAEFARWKQTEGYTARLGKGREKRATLKAVDPKRRWAQMALAASKQRAKASGLPHALTLDWLLSSAPDVCPLLEVDLRYDNTRSHHDSPAVDRIDSSGGYTPDNCWVVSMLANRIKSNATLEQVELVAKNMRLCLDKGLINMLPPPKRDKMDSAPPKKYTNPYSQ